MPSNLNFEIEEKDECCVGECLVHPFGMIELVLLITDGAL